VDALGDPLPPGALRRLGTLRNYSHHRIGFLTENRPLPDGKTVLVDSGNRIRWVDIESGRLVDAWALPVGWHTAVLSADARLVLLSDLKALQLWDVKTRQKVRDFNEVDHARTGSSAYNIIFAISPDNKVAVAHDYGARETISTFWDVSTGSVLWQESTKLKRPRDPSPWPLGFLSDGKSVLFADRWTHSPVSIRDRRTGREIRAFATSANSPGWTRLSPDGKSLLIADGSLVHVWDVATGTERPALSGHEKPARLIAVSADSRIVLSGGDDPYVLVWDLPTGKKRAKIEIGPVGGVHSRMTISADGKRAVIMVWNMQLRVLDLEKGVVLPAPAEAHRDTVAALAIAPDGKLVSGGTDNTIRVWEYSSGKQLHEYRTDHHFGVKILDLSADGQLIASAVGTKVFLYERDSGRLVRTIEAETDSRAVAFAPKGRILATLRWGSPEKEQKPNLTWWDADTGKDRHRIRLENGFRALAFSPDGGLLATVSDGRARFWDIATARKLSAPPTTGSILLSFSPDGRVLAAADWKGISFWELASGKERGRIRFEGRSENVDTYLPCLRFSPDGRWLAWARDEGVGLADVHRGSRVHSFKGHESLVTALAFAPDSRSMASSSYDTSILIWDVAGVAARQPKSQSQSDVSALTKAWEELASADAGVAFRAVRLLTDAPEKSVGLLRQRLLPAKVADPKLIERLVAALDSKSFVEREKAVHELEHHGADAAEPLREYLSRNPTADARRRAEGLLARADGPVNDSELLRSLRALEVLESIHTPEARQGVDALAKGDPRCRLTRESRSVLGRWDPEPKKAGP
jgi:WD40 repeat protein